eukprot:scaffold44473_cov48-Attheya_sp.AAC.2
MAWFAEWTGRPGTIVECDGSVSELPPFSSSPSSRGGPADPVSSSIVQKGAVKTFIKERVFRFIRYKGGAKDAFFHVRYMDEASFGDDPSSTTIDVDEKVSFVVRDDPKSGKKMAT